MDFNDFVNRFGVTLTVFRGHFGRILRTLASICAYMKVALEHLEIALQPLWRHFGYVNVSFQKTLLPSRFKYFYAALNYT